MPPRNADASADAAAPSAAMAATIAATAYKGPSGVAYSDAPVMGSKFTGYLGDHNRSKPIMSRLNWLHIPLLFSTPLIAAYGLATWTWNWKTIAFAVVYYFMTGLGITAGYHRLFAHRAYKATAPLRVALLMLGAGAVQGSVRWWARDHRAHHRYVDTEQDPYAATKGFFYAHIGWMLVKQEKERIGRVDISDLNADPWIRWQHKWYLPIALLMAIGVPTAVAGYGWGDFYGGYFIAAVARLVFVHHSTFFVNSLAHFAGDATYTDGHTARNSKITALLTVGEGYHNFHHEFPSDYRNGVEYYQYDPTKWFIRTCELLGLAYDLKRFPSAEIVKGELQMQQKRLDGVKGRLFWGPDAGKLPVVTQAQLAARVEKGERLLILDGFAVDAGNFMADHPGGEGLIKADLGKDITEKFKGGYYKHSNAAHNLVATMRVARVQGYWG